MCPAKTFIETPMLYKFTNLFRIKCHGALFVCCICSSIISNTGCKRSTEPKAVAKAFLNECGANNYEKAKIYGTEETDRLMDMLEGFNTMMAGQESKKVSYEVVSEKIEGDVATVLYKESGSSESPKSIKLVRQNSEWLVAMDKESFGTESDTMQVGGTSTE
jgi:hypothetical protein